MRGRRGGTKARRRLLVLGEKPTLLACLLVSPKPTEPTERTLGSFDLPRTRWVVW